VDAHVEEARGARLAEQRRVERACEELREDRQDVDAHR
jgi:hypothetical protein